MDERQVDQETVAIIQAAEDKCRNEGLEDRRRRLGFEGHGSKVKVMNRPNIVKKAETSTTAPREVLSSFSFYTQCQ